MVKELTLEQFLIVKDFPITVARRDPQPPYPKHKHMFTELVIVLRGRAIHAVDDFEYPIKQGDVFVIAGNREHEFKMMEDLALINIIFKPGHLPIDIRDTADLPGFRTLFFLEPEYRHTHKFESRLRIAGKNLTLASQLSKELEEELRMSRAGFRLKVTALLMELLVHLSRCYEEMEAPQSQSLMRIADAINFIENNYAEPICHDRLAEIACMSKRNFQRVFFRAMNCTAKQYVINMRINQAQELLRGLGKSITEVAYEVGFMDSNYFSRLFKRATGVSPKSYREMSNR